VSSLIACSEKLRCFLVSLKTLMGCLSKSWEICCSLTFDLTRVKPAGDNCVAKKLHGIASTYVTSYQWWWRWRIKGGFFLSLSFSFGSDILQICEWHHGTCAMMVSDSLPILVCTRKYHFHQCSLDKKLGQLSHHADMVSLKSCVQILKERGHRSPYLCP
jgi:hypothetical protein